jgi:hypothetical protein
VGVGSYFGVRAFSLKKTAEGECYASGSCTQAGRDTIESLKISETIATISIAAGVSTLALSAFLFLSGGSHDAASARRASAFSVAPDLAAHGARMELRW